AYPAHPAAPPRSARTTGGGAPAQRAVEARRVRLVVEHPLSASTCSIPKAPNATGPTAGIDVVRGELRRDERPRDDGCGASLLSSQAVMFGNGGEAEGIASGLQVVVDAQRARSVLTEWLDWCERYYVAVEAPQGDEDEGFWHLVFDHLHGLGAVHASRLRDADESLLQKLQEAGCLRTFAESTEPRGNLLWFVRGVETRVALPSGPLDGQPLSSSRAPRPFLSAPTADLPSDLRELLASLRAEARRITDEELAQLTSEPPRPVFRREVPSVRGVLPAEVL